MPTKKMLWAGGSALTIGIALTGAASVSYPRRLAFDLFFPKSTFFHGNRRSPEIAITFDDGPHPIYTPAILDILNQFGIKGTFFMTGLNTELYPEIARQVYAGGHDIGNHSYSHPKLPFCSTTRIKRELHQTDLILRETLGIIPTLFRPPYGFRDWRVLRQAQQMGYTSIFWDITTYDWERPGVEKIVERTVPTRNGSILLFHDGRGDRSQTVKAIEIVIDRLLKKGYTFRTIGQLLQNQ
ncbi:MAG: chitooligosaccharide deacetylase [Gemmatimonadetes bacterium]|nr:MAG: chitooligosaccharide deacetylase [Gemmatimonadota bacterium]